MSLILSKCFHQTFKFPSGEMHVKLNQIPEGLIDVRFIFQSNEDIIELLLLNNALKHVGSGINKLIIPFFPFGRQDRIANIGECFSLEVFADIVNSLNAKEVIVYDPHSDVIPALVKNIKIKTQHEIFQSYFSNKQNFYLISPDGGALKKIYKLSNIVKPIDVVECSKIRNVETGEITGVKVHFDDLNEKECFIVDDICDGGRTFIEIAKELKKKNSGKITLMVTHGLFTKGLDVFKGIIDCIITINGCITDSSENDYK